MVKVMLFAKLFAAAALILSQTRQHLKLALGRFFRDVSRSKARRRLYGNKYALARCPRTYDAFYTLSNKNARRRR